MWRKFGRATRYSVSWFVASVTCFYLGALVTGGLNDLLWRTGPILTPPADIEIIEILEAIDHPIERLLTAGLIIGSFSGLVQGVILRGLGGSVRGWTVVSIAGWVLGLTLRLAGSGTFAPLLAAVLLGAGQWIYLKRLQGGSGVWSVGTMIGAPPAFWVIAINTSGAEIIREWRLYLDAGLWWASLSSFFLFLYLIWWPSREESPADDPA